MTGCGAQFSDQRVRFDYPKGAFDSHSFLCHTYAMYRDNLKRLARRTWCTTKTRDRLEALLNLYAYFHNERLERAKTVVLKPSPVPI